MAGLFNIGDIGKTSPTREGPRAVQTEAALRQAELTRDGPMDKGTAWAAGRERETGVWREYLHGEMASVSVKVLGIVDRHLWGYVPGV
jgi:hypothetical protein